MILGIDVGNTNIVFGGINEGKLIFSERAATEKASVAMLLSHVSDKSFDGVILSSVVPSINSCITDTVHEIFGIDPVIVGPEMKMNIHLPEKVKKEIGADIIVGLVAAAAEYTAPLAVVDMGTASTIFALDKDLWLKGGIIHPGMVIEYNALSSETEQLPEITSVEVPDHILGQNTDECIKSGVAYGHAGMIDAILTGMEREMGTTLTVIATGGLGRLMAPICSHEIIYDEALLIKGLDYLYKMNS